MRACSISCSARKLFYRSPHGSGLQGMQHNPGVPTIESELMGALAKAGAISPANAGKFAKVWAGLGHE